MTEDPQHVRTAMDYWKRGVQVTNIRAGTKAPATEWRSLTLIRQTEDDVRTVEARSGEDGGCWVVTGGISGVVVADIDTAEGEAYLRTLPGVAEWMDATALVITGSADPDKKHYWGAVDEGFPTWRMHDEETGVSFDIQCDGAGVVAPPSKHPDTGVEYAWAVGRGFDTMLPIPDALKNAPKDAPGQTLNPSGRKGLAELLANVPQGDGSGRNDWLARVCGHLAAQSKYEDAYRALAMEQAAKIMDETFGDAEVERTIASIWAKEHTKVDSDEDGEDRLDVLAFPLTDLGNAERMAMQHQGRALHCGALGGWLVFNGALWRTDEGDKAVMALAKETIRSIYAAASTVADDVVRIKVAAWARRSESASSIRNMLKLAESEPAFVAHAADFDVDRMALNCPNGTVDLRTGTLRPHDPADLITKVTGVAYEEVIAGPFFDFLDWATKHRPELAAYLQRMAGYMLTGDVGERIIFVPHGVGRNGKSVFNELMQWVMGDYAIVYPISALMTQKHESHPTDIIRLKGARAAFASEGKRGQELNAARVKNFTGNERLTGRGMRENWVDFDPTHKLVLSTNHLPRVPGDDQATWDRIHAVPFDNRLPIDDVNTHLGQEIFDACGPGILAWAVEGCLEWQRRGLAPSAEVTGATNRYRDSQDLVRKFLSERVVKTPTGRVAAGDLHTAYTAWVTKRGQTTRIGARVFGEKVVTWLGDDTRYQLHGVMTWKGITLGDPEFDLGDAA